MLLREKWSRFFLVLSRYPQPAGYCRTCEETSWATGGNWPFRSDLAHKVKWASAAHKERLGLRVRLDGRASVDYRGSKARRDLLGLRETKDHEACIGLRVAEGPAATSAPDPEGRVAALEGLVSSLMASPTPRPTAAATMGPSDDLANTDLANLWVIIENDEFGRLRVNVDAAFDIDEFDLDVFVDSEEYCNTVRIYQDEGIYEMGCGSLEKSHGLVERVSAQTRNQGDLRCAGNVQSLPTESVFACRFR